ncbi:MAG: ECF-type sigma factor [Acidobacteriota bacterium]
MTDVPSGNHGVTELLLAWRAGDEQALDGLVPLVYEELRRIARRHLRREQPGHTLAPTALVNEAYLRLIDAQQVKWQDRLHFFAVASRIMRRVLVDAARAKRANKRGGSARRVTFDDRLAVSTERALDLVALDDALLALAAADPRKARVVELRVFCGLSVQEIASVIGVSTDTVTRDWKFVTSWLKRELGGEPA